jgi:hypothetical protein
LALGAFSGITLGDWLRMLRENRYSIDWPYWGRAAAITLGSVSNSVLGQWESLGFGRKIRAAKVEPPLFILGIWRSGTTHLHNLLAKDDRFAYPTFYQAVHPHTFLHMEAVATRALGMLLPKTRPQDNVRLGMGEPYSLGINLRCHILTRVERFVSNNVIGMAEGSDSALKSEAIVFTAHWDHLGVGRAVLGDAIYNGAADNATGCALLLELARAWSELPKPSDPPFFWPSRRRKKDCSAQSTTHRTRSSRWERPRSTLTST